MVNEAIISKLATTAIEKAALERAPEVTKPLEGTKSPFQGMLEQMDAGQEMVEMLGIGRDTSLPGAKFESMSADNITLSSSELNVGLEEPKGIDKIVDLLSDVNKGQMQMDGLVNEILYSGKRFSNQELLAIQAHVFHFAQMTELTVKVAEHGVTSVKSILNTQVQ